MLSLRYNELELYTVSYLGALLNTAYDTYLYCVNLTGSVVRSRVRTDTRATTCFVVRGGSASCSRYRYAASSLP